VLIAVGYYAYTKLSIEEEEEKKDEATAEQIIRTTVTELDVQDYPVVIRTNGIVQAHNEVTLSAEVSGRVTRVSPSFEVGSYFSEGDVLVELDERDFKTAVAVAEAAHLSAESALQLAIKNHDRNLKLYDNQVISISEGPIRIKRSGGTVKNIVPRTWSKNSITAPAMSTPSVSTSSVCVLAVGITRS